MSRGGVGSGELKSNVQSRLDYLSDVFGNLSELVHKFDTENRQMRQFITVLLHFKYMLQFLRSKLVREEELYRLLGPEAAVLFKTDLKLCSAKFAQIIEPSKCPESLSFVNEKSEYYQSNNSTYCSYKEDDVLCLRKRKGQSEPSCTSTSKQGNNHSQDHVTPGRSDNKSSKANHHNDHHPLKIEPEIELIELAASGNGTDSDDSPNDGSHFVHIQQQPPQSFSSAPNHRTREKSNDLKLTIVNSGPCRKVVKRSAPIHDPPDEGSGGSNCSNNRELPCSKKSRHSRSANMFAFERQHSQEDQDYDFDYEHEFEEDGSLGQFQFRCPQSACLQIFESEQELNEHISTMHFNLLELINTFDCLVEGCQEKFPNLARANVHMKNAHPDAYITCEQCAKQVKAHYLRKHVYMRHRKGEYKCSPDCDFVAEYYHELEKHRYMQHYNRYAWLDPAGHGLSAAAASSSSASHNFSSNNNYANNNHGSGSQNGDSVAIRIKRFVCKWTDCGFSHEARGRVLKHIRVQHLGQCSRNGIAQQANSADDQKALAYLDVLDFGEVYMKDEAGNY